MLSGNGRHRRPRQAPALLVAAGVTGSAIAIPLLGATGASAASGTTWDAIAECESGGSWSANSGNGYYGGLQMTQVTWEKHGGLDYAPSADQASRSQQIAVAEKVLAAQGTSAWATCGLVAGLTQNSGSADVDTGATDDSPTPSSGLGMDDGNNGTKSDTSGSSGSSGSSEAPKGSVSPKSSTSPSTTKSDDSDKSSRSGDTSADASESAATDGSGSGRHRGDSADEEAPDSDAGDSSGRHASPSDSESRVAAEGSYTVRSGDSLWGIADSLGIEGGWRALYAENKEAVGDDPDFILPGQSLDIDAVPVAAK
ncbi:transglycosylase family protein [Streptomyces sp. NBC_00878]|uniref:LysM peptidoglycan-binding domain-containing protein n=1 Tax=Streptomyces sp. NBC_00878 TaxID=2975854 RepID=UPI002256E491|nr:transglycosylase family protein [Streptomyces sp. NBC_00878]MCX4906133.1 LysM peptidoglycan-binding domain-containing protein [Streptomyces sp. NBC_00878]